MKISGTYPILQKSLDITSTKFSGIMFYVILLIRK